jgi:hypothetical protein
MPNSIGFVWIDASKLTRLCVAFNADLPNDPKSSVFPL